MAFSRVERAKATIIQDNLAREYFGLARSRSIGYILKIILGVSILLVMRNLGSVS